MDTAVSFNGSAIDLANHPCFNKDARHTYSRVHLPVAPRCNMQCDYCDRKFSCVNESRPGVACTLLTPHQALDYVQRLVVATPNLSVIGIAGPGDPFANPEETMETLRLVRSEFPHLLLCVATNGLDLLPHVAELAALNVSHVTVTVNAVDPEIGVGIYDWMHYEDHNFTGTMAAELLWENQRKAIQALKSHGVLVKINTILIPGVNDHHITEVAGTVAQLGADILNIMPLDPTRNTVFGSVEEPSPALVEKARKQAQQFLPQMSHCSRCRADAAGLLGVESTPEQFELLRSVAQTAPAHSEPSGGDTNKCSSGGCGDKTGMATT
jgi:nitrogen fixation protein NifB